MIQGRIHTIIPYFQCKIKPYLQQTTNVFQYFSDLLYFNMQNPQLVCLISFLSLLAGLSLFILSAEVQYNRRTNTFCRWREEPWVHGKDSIHLPQVNLSPSSQLVGAFVYLLLHNKPRNSLIKFPSDHDRREIHSAFLKLLWQIACKL